MIAWINRFAFAAFALCLALLLPLPHATDPSLLTFCKILLNESAAPAPVVVPAEENETLNITFGMSHNDAQAALASANATIEKMQQAGIQSAQVRDTYLLAKEWFDGQSSLELGGETPNYRFVMQKALEIAQIERNAFAVNDDLQALTLRMNQTDPAVNLSEAFALRAEAIREFEDGRFAEAQKLVDSAYAKTEQAEAETVRSNTLLESTRRNLETFLKENWQNILIVALALIVLFFIFQKQIRRFLTNAKINSLIAERKALESMIRRTQKGYFESGEINEMTYHIKVKKYGDLIRNINRQLPLLKEELKKI